MSKKYVYIFSEGDASMKNLLGGKCANLSEMSRIGLPVPEGFTITTEACNKYYADGEVLSKEVEDQIHRALTVLEVIAEKKFGDEKNPLLVSVRSGARASMPGMMDTILNLGLNDITVDALANLTNNERFAYDSYRRFLQMFADVEKGVSKAKYDKILESVKEAKGVKLDTELYAEDLKKVVAEYKELYKKEIGHDFPQDAREQLMESVKAVFRSWNNERAQVYRRLNHIPSDWGTAVNVQIMVFGNMGDDCGTGVAFTRSPATGEKKLFGEYLMNAQGEDVVAGIRTPHPISQLEKDMPEVYREFAAIAERLENHYADMQDMEYTIERGKLYMLQTRNGKRTAAAALKIAVDMVEEGKLTRGEALLKIEPNQLDSVLHPQFDAEELKKAVPIASGLPASPGAAAGKIVFSAEEAVEKASAGEKVVLCRMETSPEDIEGMNAAQGILTSRGGMTSHAAVVARGMGTCCVAGCGEIRISEENRTITLEDGTVLTDQDSLSIDGSTGNVYKGMLPTVDAELTGYFAIVMSWADELRRLRVRTNADSPADAKQAVKFGAEGIGLCRTEHMFFAEDRIQAVREMIVSGNRAQREKALAKILPMQRGDFEGIYKAMGGRPVTVRLLDPPLHEFLPTDEEDIRDLAQDMNMPYEELLKRIEKLHEFNPMMGHRGCRLAVTYPEIAQMQTRAIIEAAINVRKETGLNIEPEIMIPLVGEVKELKYVKEIVDETAKQVMAENGCEFKYLCGTMIEIPRAALTADEIAKSAQFFSFGTNDLTQMTFGFSRDDAGKFLSDYYEKRIYEEDPFSTIDKKGVGKLVDIAAKLGRKTRPDLHLGICGEHGGDPASIEFCHNVGLDYVSCSPFRVPIARLAAAQAAIKNTK